MMPLRLIPLVALLTCALPTRAAESPTSVFTLYVAPEGKDNWSGRRSTPTADLSDGPLASLRGARDAVRRLRALPTPAEATIRVRFADGTYALTEPVVFEPIDSGSPGAPVIYEAAPRARPVFTGGRRLSGWKKSDGYLWQIQIPEAKAGGWQFEQLWVNGRRATRARSPNQGYFFMDRALPTGLDPLTRTQVNLADRLIRGQGQDLEALRRLPADLLSDLTVVVYHSWEISRHRGRFFDPTNSLLYLASGAAWPFMRWAPQQRYHLENFREALNSPGEWFLERNGTLLYWPLPGEDLSRADVWAPVAEQFILLRGVPTQSLWVQHLEFRGLQFHHGQYLLPPQGHFDNQAARTVPAVIQADGARSVHFVDCQIAHVGLAGFWFRTGCVSNRIERCQLQDLGAGGVRFGHYEWHPATPAPVQTHHNLLDNSILTAGGRIHHGAVGVWIGHSGDNVITHNEISDLYYTGISVGWRWGYDPSPAKRNQIEYNHIHHLGRGVLSDLGGIYTLGPSEGTTLRHNHIHDIESYDLYGRGGWGIYNDEGSTGILIENNLVYNTASGSYHQHYGRENIVRNNIFAFSREGLLQRSRVENHVSFFFERNISLERSAPLLVGSWLDTNVVLRSNLWWRLDDQPVLLAQLPLAQWQREGRDSGSIVADPRFRNPAAGDFRLPTQTPARTIHFQPFDPAQAGPYGDNTWLRQTRKNAFGDWARLSRRFLPPPVPLADDFDWQPVGNAVVTGARILLGGGGDALTVTDTTAANGRHSLKMQDAPGLKHRFNPHFFFEPRYTNGVAVCRFAIQPGPGTEFCHEWRDAQRPYRVGPSFWIAGDQLLLGNQKFPIPTNAWTRCEIQATLGREAKGTWQLTLTQANQPPRVFTNLACNPQWRSLDWVGFISNADTATVLYLDDIAVSNASSSPPTPTSPSLAPTPPSTRAPR